LPEKKIAVVGTFDTKGKEFEYLIRCIQRNGGQVLTIDTGIKDAPTFTPDISRNEVAERGGSSITELVKKNDRGEAVDVMMKGAAQIVASLYEQGEIAGIISLGGSAGTTIGTYAMRALPVGVPKFMVSTVASGDTRAYIGEKDIAMMYSIVDISGINRISEAILSNAAHAITGMVNFYNQEDHSDSKPMIAATMFGVTTPCVTEAKEYLESKGYEVLVFHATGSGGRSMESLIEGGFIAGVLDITTTELADELAGGVFSAGPDRLLAAGRKGIPQVVSLGALDMVNFGPMETVPEKCKKRKLYKHNATVTLMRTTKEENAQLGKIISEKLNQSRGPCSLFVPLNGVSFIDAEGKPFYGKEEDQALFESIRKHLDPSKVELIELENNINDKSFALAMAQKLEHMLQMEGSNK